MPRRRLAAVATTAVSLAVALALAGTAHAAAPVPYFWQSPYFAKKGQAIEFYGSARDVDGGALMFAWDFDEDGITDAEGPRASLPEGLTPGDHLVALKVTDLQGEQRTFTQFIEVRGDTTNPVGSASDLPDSVRDGTPVSLSGAFTDPDGPSSGIAVEWDFGDGTTSTETTPEHTFPAPATYVVRATGTDGDGLTGSVAKVVKVHAGNAPPEVAAPSWSPSAPIAGAAVTYAAPASDDVTSPASLTYEWDFGDGTTSTAKTPTHAFATNGNHLVELTVTDGEGGSTTVAGIVPVGQPVNAPTSHFTTGSDYRPSTHQDAPRAGVAIQFDNLSHTSTGGAIASSLWDFGDGSTSTAFEPTHTFVAPGDHVVTLRVTDGSGRTHDSVRTMHVHADDLAPVVTASVSTAAPHTGADVDFDAEAWDLDDPAAAVTYSWDFGDGSAPVTGADPTHAYAAAGDYVAIVTATSAGKSSRQAVALSVDPTNPGSPNADFSYRKTAAVGELVHFGGSGPDPDFDGVGQDPDGDPLTYLWEFGDGVTATSGNPNHAYATPGTYLVKLTQNDGRGGVSTKGLTIFILEPGEKPPPPPTPPPSPPSPVEEPATTQPPPAQTAQQEAPPAELVAPAPAPPVAPKPQAPAPAPAAKGGSADQIGSDLRTALAAPAGRARALGAKRSVTTAFSARGAGTVKLRWRVGRVVVAKGTRTVFRAGNARVRVVLTAAGRRLLRRAKRRVKVAADATFTSPRGSAVKATRTFSLRP